MHGLGSYKESWLAPRTKFEEKSTQLKDDLLSRGYNLLIPDAPFHGERSYELDFLPAHLLPPEISQSTEAAEKMVELYQNSVQEIRLMVDLIQAQASGTPEQIHLVGYSLGGAVAILVNAVDDRLGSIAACVPPINRPISEVKSFNWPEGLVKKLAEVTPFSHAEQQKAPTAIFYGEEDIYYSQTEIQDFYLRAPVPEKLVKGYPTGHELPASYIQDVIEWIEQHSA